METLDWGQILNSVVITILGSLALSIVASVVVLIKWLSGLTKISAQLVEVTTRLANRGEENQLLFEWVDVLGTGMKTGELNDKHFDVIEEKTDKYLRDKIE